MEKTAKESDEHESSHLSILKEALDLVEQSMVKLNKDVAKISEIEVGARLGMAEQWIKVKYSWSEDNMKKHLTSLEKSASLVHLVLTMLQM